MDKLYVKVEPRMVYFLCDKCESRMDHEQGGFLTSPPKAWYKCPSCGHRKTGRDGYPKVEFVEINEKNY